MLVILRHSCPGLAKFTKTSDDMVAWTTTNLVALPAHSRNYAYAHIHTHHAHTHRYGEEDHLRIICTEERQVGTGDSFLLDSVDQLHKTLNMMEARPFQTSPKYGYVTSNPANLGTGMRASVQLPLPTLTAGGIAKARALTKPLDIEVRQRVCWGVASCWAYAHIYPHTWAHAHR